MTGAPPGGPPRPAAEGVLVWTSPAGRTYRTHPDGHRRPDHSPEHDHGQDRLQGQDRPQEHDQDRAPDHDLPPF